MIWSTSFFCLASMTRFRMFRLQSPPVSWAVSSSTAEKPASTRLIAASTSWDGFSAVLEGPFHLRSVYALRIAGSLENPGAWMRPRATASANRAS